MGYGEPKSNLADTLL